MAVKVILPQFGESVVEGTITKWLKHEGDAIEEFEPLVEVNTDKVDTEVPSPASGTLLKILIEEGVTAEAGTVIAWIGDPEEALPQPGSSPTNEPAASTSARLTKDAQEPPTTAEAASMESPGKGEPSGGEAGVPVRPSPRPGKDEELGFISPVVAKIAAEHQLDLSQVAGTGRGRRITKRDVEAYLESAPSRPSPVADRPPAAPPEEAEAPAPASAGIAPGELLRLSPVRRSIAAHMVESKHTSPHVTTVMEADLSRVSAHRSGNKETFSRDGANLTFTAYFVAAAVAALKAFPLVNSSWSENGIQLHRQLNVGMAASLGEDGLIVPVIRQADGLSLLGIARTVNDLAERARARKLQPEEVQGGTFTITNHGTSGSLFATPIINQPQCAILGVGVIQKRPVVIQDAIAIRPMVYISLTFDHRILDGATADHFLAKIVETLESWAA